MGVNEEYFEWIYQRIDGKGYRSLLEVLYNTEFTYSLTMDENRLLDGVELRYRFARECGYTRRLIPAHFDNSTCSVLEVMVALAVRMEETIFDDPVMGDRTYTWFWNMVDSLGLGDMTDEEFNYEIVTEVMDTFLNRYYSSDGYGGLFYVPDASDDMREVEIWYQMCMYADTLLGL